MDESTIQKIVSEGVSIAQKGVFRKREIFERAVKLLGVKQILSLVGVRRCGKSTIMKLLVRKALTQTTKENILYLNVEQPYFNQYKEKVENLQKIYEIFLRTADKRKKIFVFLDEIQFFSDWQIFVKWLYEKNEAKIILTGSNSRLLSSELTTLLSGRTIPLFVYPYSYLESQVPLKKYLIDGGFPEVLQLPTAKTELAENYYKNILYQDVIPRFGVKHTAAIENLSYFLLTNAGKELSYNTLKHISGLDDKTVKEYISHLQDANLLYLIHNYDFSLKKLIGNKKKAYIVDPLFAQVSFKHTPDSGRLFENLLYMHLRREGHNIYFHQNGGECDFILKKGHRITNAIQACYELTKENELREINGILSAAQKFKLTKGIIVTLKQKRTIKKEGVTIQVIPINEFIKKFGIHSEN